MKSTYYVLHLVAILLYLLLTYLAFLVLIPFYLLVVYGGFHLWKLFMEKYESHRILVAAALGVMQSTVFLLLVLTEFMIAGVSIGYNQFMLAVTLCSYVGIGFLLIAIATTLQYQKSKRVSNYV